MNWLIFTCILLFLSGTLNILLGLYALVTRRKLRLEIADLEEAYNSIYTELMDKDSMNDIGFIWG